MQLDNEKLAADRTAIDTTMETYRRDLGEETTTMIVALFDGDSRTQINALDDSLQAADMEGCRKIAHKLKGSFAQMGAEYTADLCSQAEQAASKGDIATVADLSPAVRNAWQNLLAHLLAQS